MFTDLLLKNRTANRSRLLTEDISEVVFERELHNQTNQESLKIKKQLPSCKIFKNENSDKVMLNKIIFSGNNDVFNPSSHFLNAPIEN